MRDHCAVAHIDEWIGKPRISEWLHHTRTKLPTPTHSAFTVIYLDTLTDAATLESEFSEHAAKWAAETAHISSIEKAAMHPSYQCILAMGERVVPLILRELRGKPNHWFWALRFITNENPVKPQDAGNVRKMVDAWLEWGHDRNLL